MTPAEVIRACLLRAKDKITAKQILDSVQHFDRAEADFVKAVQLEKLHTLKEPNFKLSTVGPDVLSKQLYELGMVSREEGRVIYEKIRRSANGVCPLCDLGEPYTLDHHMPKKRYPLLSVSIPNLIPACYVCNQTKRETVATTPDDEPLHPYYDRFVNSQRWLAAQVLPDMTVEYYVDPPPAWTPVQANRVRAHVEKFDLLNRYAIRFSNRISNIRQIIEMNFSLGGASLVSIDLMTIGTSHVTNHKNDFEGVGYLAVAADHAFCNGGFDSI
ncbi:hypothetical protein AB0P23_14250 [Rhodococcus sp. NPDC077669]|uniref:HNH endonuclease n=1 Tax=Rhodococcus sp. NPDC077669 TaxID=3155174 RepID=UPI003431FA25